MALEEARVASKAAADAKAAEKARTEAEKAAAEKAAEARQRKTAPRPSPGTGRTSRATS